MHTDNEDHDDDHSVGDADDDFEDADMGETEEELPPVDPLVAAEEAKAKANARYKEGDYRAAVELYSEAVALVPSNATYLANRSAAYTMLRNFAECLRDCRAAIAMDPTQCKLYLRAAKALVFMGDLEAAKAFLRDGVQAARQSKGTWELAEKCNEEIASITSIQSSLAVVSAQLEAASAPTATATQKTKSFLAALTAIETAMILADPSNAKQSRSSSTSSRLLTADLNNLSPKWKLQRAECLVGLLELGEAAKVVSNQVLSYDSTNSEGLALRAQILYLNDSHSLAHVVQLLTNALAYDPDNKRARVFWKKIKALEVIKKEGNEAYGASSWDAAEEKYSKFLEEDTIGGVVRVKVLSNRAIVRSKAGRHSPTVADCTTAIELLQTLCFPRNQSSSDEANSPSSADIASSTQSSLFLKLHLRRADSNLKLEAYDKSVQDYHVCAEIKPEDREIANALRRAQKAEKTAKRKDYYKILGVDKSADEGAIKKAYRKMALQYHPDKQASLPEEERHDSDAKFKEISEAYSVLSDPQKKQMFDSGMDIDGSSASGGMNGNPFGGGGEDMQDILRMFMNGGGGGGFQGGFPGGQRGYGGGHSHGHGHGHGGHSFHFG
ncbi:hypothetical protein HDU78_010074 [Chytriomyces hyalinus]|nr:hypothetical protein HDU78_010074 [Chytriomyces hyalinus]